MGLNPSGGKIKLVWKRGVSLFLIPLLLQFLIAQEGLAFVRSPNATDFLDLSPLLRYNTLTFGSSSFLSLPGINPTELLKKKNPVLSDSAYCPNCVIQGAMYDPTAREFRGFREVTVTDAAGTKTIHTFGQTDHDKGKLLQKEVRDSSNNLFSKEVTTWDDTHPYTDVHFVFVSQQDNYVYDGNGTNKQTRQTFTYDTYGNLASVTEEGDVSVSTDSRKTVNTYVYNTTDYVVNKVSKTTLYDTDLTTIKAERYFYYDGATSITTAPVIGLLTKEEEWLNTSCGTPGTGCAGSPTTTMAYDSYGNLTTVTDARGYQTTNDYDTTYKLFLIKITSNYSGRHGPLMGAVASE